MPSGRDPMEDRQRRSNGLAVEMAARASFVADNHLDDVQ